MDQLLWGGRSSCRHDLSCGSSVSLTQIAFISQGACILTGIGFNGYDVETKKPLWDRVVNVNVWGIETSQSYKVLFDSWNTRANVSSGRDNTSHYSGPYLETDDCRLKKAERL